MGEDQTTRRSRRSLLAAAAGGAAALAAQAALPLTAAAADPNDLTIGVENHATARTALLRDDDTVGAIAFTVNAVGSESIGTESFGAGMGIRAGGGSAAGTYSFALTDADAATIAETAFTGVYGWAPAGDTTPGTGVWGDSPDFGVYGTGYFGVYGSGTVGVTGQAETTSAPGVQALGATASSPALKVTGKVSFNRSGRKLIGAGKTSVVVALAGVTTSSKIFAVLSNNRSGRYVRAVVPGTNQFTIHLNTSYTSQSYIAWFVID